MSKPTPGPWEIGGLDRNGQQQVVGEAGPLVAVCAHECVTARVPEMEANALLIAAAPEAYEALRWLVHLHHDVGKAGERPESGEWEAAIEAGKAAIAKAEEQS